MRPVSAPPRSLASWALRTKTRWNESCGDKERRSGARSLSLPLARGGGPRWRQGHFSRGVWLVLQPHVGVMASALVVAAAGSGLAAASEV
jgi:hypothetical protein